MRVECQAGKMRKRFEVQQFAMPAANTFNEMPKVADKNWTTIATRYGELEPMTGREVAEAQETRGDVTHRIRIRYFAGLGPTMRLKLGARIFNIVYVLNVTERNRKHEVEVKEETPRVQ